MFSFKFKISMYESKWCIFLLRALVSEVSYFAKQFDCNLKLFVGYKKPICLAMWHRIFMLKFSFQENIIANQYACHWCISIYYMLDKLEDLILS